MVKKGTSMTKNFPDKLCIHCEEFDYCMNRKGGVSRDVFVVCECDRDPISESEKISIENFRIAREAYKQVVKAITDLEDIADVTFSLPEFVEVNGEKFQKSELHIFSRPKIQK
jgi:hypothetical protein